MNLQTRGEGVKKSEFFADVLNGSPLSGLIVESEECNKIIKEQRESHERGRIPHDNGALAHFTDCGAPKMLTGSWEFLQGKPMDGKVM